VRHHRAGSMPARHCQHIPFRLRPPTSNTSNRARRDRDGLGDVFQFHAANASRKWRSNACSTLTRRSVGVSEQHHTGSRLPAWPPNLRAGGPAFDEDGHARLPVWTPLFRLIALPQPSRLLQAVSLSVAKGGIAHTL
jgi:hypothetical protein